uniref:TTI1 C-terminal TPR domain-containing protein n=1 Tax=Aureoumbra lagunensis TaxID=44058 RepID=A0A7S3JMR0_9STRA
MSAYRRRLVGDDRKEDVSVALCDYVDAMSMCLERSEEKAVMSSEILLRTVSNILLRPPDGRRKDDVIERAARMAVLSLRKASSLQTDDCLRFLGGCVLQLTNIVHNSKEGNAQIRFEECEETGLYLVQASRYLIESIKLQVWKVLDNPDSEAPVGRGLVAAVAKLLLDLASNDLRPRRIRRESLLTLKSFVQATPTKMQAPLWRCFLPGLFGGLASLTLRPSAPVDGAILKALALDTATTLVDATLKIKKEKSSIDINTWLQQQFKTHKKETHNNLEQTTIQKDILSRMNTNENRIEVTDPVAWENEAQIRIANWLPPMLSICRRDPDLRVRLAAVHAAGTLIHFSQSAALDTLAALRFDENPNVAKAAKKAIDHCTIDFNIEWNSTMKNICNAAHSGNESNLLDTLNILAGKLVISHDLISHENARCLMNALAAAGELSIHAMNVTALESPPPPPNGMCCLNPNAELRRAAATRLGAVAHAPAYEWLRLAPTRDAYRRCAWLLLLKPGALSAAADCLTTAMANQNKEDATAIAHVLAEGLEALAGEAQLIDSSPRDISTQNNKTKELLGLASALADDILLKLEEDQDEDAQMNSESIVAIGKSCLSSQSNVLTAILCRVLALCVELSSCIGGYRSQQSLLRRALYPLLEKLAHTDAVTRQAALASLVHLAAANEMTTTPIKNFETDALATLLQMNMDYVVDAGCRRLRAAKSAEAAAQASGVLEALLRHSKCSLATPLLSDLARYALRDIDDHCIHPNPTHHLAYIRLLSAILSTLTSSSDQQKHKQSEQKTTTYKEDWLTDDESFATLLKDQGGFQSALEPVLGAMKDGKITALKAENGDKEKGNDDETKKNLREQFRSIRNHYKKKDAEDDKREPNAEEKLVIQVLLRVRYFTSPGFDLIIRRFAFESIAQAAKLLNSNHDQLRPLVHDIWYTIQNRLPKTNEEYFSLLFDDDIGEASLCLSAVFNVICIFVDTVGNFLSYKFKEDIWPAIHCVLSDHSLSTDDNVYKNRTSSIPRAHRHRLLESAIYCLAAFGRYRDTQYLLKSIAAQAVPHLICHNHPVIPHTIRALAAIDADSIWVILLQAYATLITKNDQNFVPPYTKPPLPFLPKWSTKPPLFDSCLYFRDMRIALDVTSIVALLKECDNSFSSFYYSHHF